MHTCEGQQQRPRPIAAAKVETPAAKAEAAGPHRWDITPLRSLLEESADLRRVKAVVYDLRLPPCLPVRARQEAELQQHPRQAQHLSPTLSYVGYPTCGISIHMR